MVVNKTTGPEQQIPGIKLKGDKYAKKTPVHADHPAW